MEWRITFVLAAAGIAGGLINAVAGGATLITFPAMLYAGLPPVIANASNAVAISPGHLVAAFADRTRLPAFDWRTRAFLVASILGGVLGASVLLLLPERLFTLPVPALVAFATVLFAFAPLIQKWTSSHRRSGAASARAAIAAVGMASIYGGFFGAGLGVILTAVLSITEQTDLRAIKVLKNLLATGVSIAATTVFIVQGAVRWPETLVMFGGAIVGGYFGGWLIRVLPVYVVRFFIVCAGTFMSILYAARYWL